MSDMTLYFNKLSYTQCRKAVFPQAADMTGEFTKVDSEAFQNCMVRFYDSFRVVAEEIVEPSNWSKDLKK
jgi:hypothetical protein